MFHYQPLLKLALIMLIVLKNIELFRNYIMNVS